MKTAIAVLISFGIVAALLWIFREYMPGALLIAAVPIVVVAAVASKIQKDPLEGWSLARKLGIFCALPLTVWSLMVMAASDNQRSDYLFAIPVVLVVDILFVLYASTKIYKMKERIAFNKKWS